MEAATSRFPRAAIDTIEALLAGTEEVHSSEWFFRLQQQCSGLRQPLQFKVSFQNTITTFLANSMQPQRDRP